MSQDIMCNGHRFVKSNLFQSPGYLADLSPYITAVISSRLLATPIQITANAIKPLAPLAHSILPARATSYILSGTLTCEYCLHQVSQDLFDDGRVCPSLLLNKFAPKDDDFVLADQLLEAQARCRVDREKERLKRLSNLQNGSTNNPNQSQQAESTTQTNNSNQTNLLENATNASISSHIESTNNVDDYDDESNKLTKYRNENVDIYKSELLIMEICPEIGLHAQAFTCIDCDKEIDLNTSRLCHYDGRYYCYQCHTGSDLLPIPARVLRSWDFTPKPVSKTSLQKICFLRTKPVLFNLFQMNSMLYGFIERLVEIKQYRERIQSMLKYLQVCGQPDRPYLIPVPKHFLDEDLLNFFTLNDLFDINQVYDLLSQLQTNLETHIVRKCESCRGKGFYCELCKDPHDILYPFSKNGAICNKCHTVYHKNCFQRKKKNCPRCVRLNTKRHSMSKIESSNAKNDDTTNTDSNVIESSDINNVTV